MSGWTNIDLTTINPNPEIVPAQEYAFSLNGAKYSEMYPGKIECNATIVTEGDFTGRKLFFSYPDPAVKDWSPKALKKLEIALGVDINVGEDPVEYLNRCAGMHFGAMVSHSKPSDEYPNPRANLNIFSVKAAA
jgi:hypothetical protein